MRDSPPARRRRSRADDEALAVGVAENVIRADLNPVEEARAYRRLVDEHGDIAKVAAPAGRASDWLPSASTSCACRSRPGTACRPPRSARLIVKRECVTR
jgi:hypothetical protein